MGHDGTMVTAAARMYLCICTQAWTAATAENAFGWVWTWEDKAEALGGGARRREPPMHGMTPEESRILLPSIFGSSFMHHPASSFTPALFMSDAGQGVAASPRDPVREQVRELVPSLEGLRVTYGAMDDFNSETDSDYTSYWRDWFISSRGNEYLTDRFNLTGLNTEVQYYQYALDLVTDVFDFDCDDDMREQIEKSARHLYGLVHARYVVTTRGLAKMVCRVHRPFPRPQNRRGCVHKLTPPSSRSSKSPTSASAPASCASPSRSSPWASPTSQTPPP
jgi:hypothetical protein